MRSTRSGDSVMLLVVLDCVFVTMTIKALLLFNYDGCSSRIEIDGQQADGKSRSLLLVNQGLMVA